MLNIINQTIITLLGYNLTYIELIGVLFGFWSVYLATKNNIHTWSTGILNIIAFFIIFYQSKLYSSMSLQVFFFIASVYGWINWGVKEDKKIKQINISYQIPIMIVAILLTGYIMKYFNSTYSYIDAIIIVLSIYATILMANRIVICWSLWIIVDVVSIILYTIKGLYLISFEYFIFFFLAFKGYQEWNEMYIKRKIL